MPSPYEQLLSATLDTFKSEYEELSEVWRNLDAKAQGNVAVCGIFVAGILAFISDAQGHSCCQKILLSSTIACLSICVVIAVLVLRVREVVAAPMGERLAELVNDLAAAGDFDDVRFLNFLADQARLWRDANDQVREVNHKKADCLFASQCLLVIAIGLAITTILFKLWG
jgi:hypothetical protein